MSFAGQALAIDKNARVGGDGHTKRAGRGKRATIAPEPKPTQAITPAVDNKALTPAERPHFSPIDKGFVERFLKAEGYIPVDEIKPGMEGYGLTVFQGTKIEKFDVKVIGVIRQVLSGRDAILIRTSGAVMGQNNVVRGMSGSPIYINGRLAGALSYGFDFSKEPIVGVTPVVDMLDALSFDSSGAPKRLTHLPSRDTISSTDAQPTAPTNVQSGAPHLVPLLAPVSLSGYSSRAKEYLEGELKDVGLSVTSGATGGLSPELISLVRSGMTNIAQAPGVDDKPTFNLSGNKKVVPGQAVSVMLSTGDFASAATGTATCAFDNKFIAFGHAFLEAGSVSFPLATAYIHQILPSLAVSFKMSSPVEIIGTIFADRPWSVGGQVGRMPELLPIKLSVADEERGVRKTYNCQVVEHPDLTRTLVTASVMSAMDATFQSQSPYVVKVKTEMDVEGYGKVERTDRFAVNFPAHITGSSADLLAKLRMVREPVSGFVGGLVDRVIDNDFQKARITGIHVDMVVEAGRKVSHIERIALDKGTVAPGEKVSVTCTLKPFDGPSTIEKMVFTMPRDLPDGDVAIGICGGDEVETLRRRMGVADPTPENLSQIIARIKRRERSDKLCGIIALPRQSLILNGEVLRNPPAQWVKLFYSDKATKPPILVRSEERVTRNMDDIIDGAHVVAVSVKRPDKLFAKPLPYVVNPPVVSAVDGIYMTEQARKALDSGRKGDPSTVAGLVTMLASGAAATASATATPAVTPPAPATPAPVDKTPPPPSVWSIAQSYPHMRAVNVWRLDQDDKRRAGETDGVIVDSLGRLVPGFKELDHTLVTNESRVFAGATYKGVFYFCAGKGLYSYNLSSKSVQRLAELPGLFITTLSVDDDGTAYITTSGKGEIYTCNVTATGTLGSPPRLVAQTSEEVITAATLDQNGRLYVGTNSSGKLYRLDKGALSFVEDLGQAHITALHYSTYDKRLYVGTAERGIVYSFGEKFDKRSEYETGEHIVTGVAKDRAGNLYVTTAGQGKFMRIDPRGIMDVVALSDAFYTLYYDKKQDRVYSGDAEGDITRFEVDAMSQKPYFYPVCHTEQEAVLAIASDGNDHLYIGTSNIAQVIALAINPSEKPSYTSIVFDAQKKSIWSRFQTYDADSLENPGVFDFVKVETRGGNTALPDDTWSGWTGLSQGDNTGYSRKINTAPSRYLQYRMTWLPGESKKNNAVGMTEVTYQPVNSAPVISGFTVGTTGMISGTETFNITVSDPDSDNVSAQLAISSDGGKTFESLEWDVRSRTTDDSKLKKAAKEKAKAKAVPTTSEQAAGEAAKASEAKASDRKASEGKIGEGKASEAKADVSKASEPKTTEPKASEPKAQDSKDAKPVESKDLNTAESKEVKDQKAADGKDQKATEVKDAKAAEVKDQKTNDVKDQKTADAKDQKPADVKDQKVSTKEGKETKDVKESKEEKAEAVKFKEEAYSNKESLTYTFDSKKYADGIYMVMLTVSDRPSNAADMLSTSDMQVIYVDNTPPTIDDLKVEQDAKGNLSISFVANDKMTPISGATYHVDKMEPFSFSPSSATLPDCLSVPLKATDIATLKTSKKVTLEVTDRAGNKTVKVIDLPVKKSDK